MPLPSLLSYLSLYSPSSSSSPWSPRARAIVAGHRGRGPAAEAPRCAARGGCRGREEATATTRRSTAAARRAHHCKDAANRKSLLSLRCCSHCCVLALPLGGHGPEWAVSSVDLIFGLWASGACGGRRARRGAGHLFWENIRVGEKIITLYYIEYKYVRI